MPVARLYAQNVVLDDLEFDVSESETHTSSVTVTRHPVERGSAIADHAVEEPDTLDLQLRQSNTPIVTPGEAAALDPFRAEAAYERLRELKSARLPMSVITSLRGYLNMLITSVRVTRDASKGNVLAVQVSLTQIRTATSETIADPDPVDPRAGKKKTQGKKPTTPASAPVEEKSRTTLLELGRKVSSNLKALSQ